MHLNSDNCIHTNKQKFRNFQPSSKTLSVSFSIESIDIEIDNIANSF